MYELGVFFILEICMRLLYQWWTCGLVCLLEVCDLCFEKSYLQLNIQKAIATVKRLTSARN